MTVQMLTFETEYEIEKTVEGRVWANPGNFSAVVYYEDCQWRGFVIDVLYPCTP